MAPHWHAELQNASYTDKSPTRSQFGGGAVACKTQSNGTAGTPESGTPDEDHRPTMPRLPNHSGNYPDNVWAACNGFGANLRSEFPVWCSPCLLHSQLARARCTRVIVCART